MSATSARRPILRFAPPAAALLIAGGIGSGALEGWSTRPDPGAIRVARVEPAAPAPRPVLFARAASPRDRAFALVVAAGHPPRLCEAVLVAPPEPQDAMRAPAARPHPVRRGLVAS